MESWNGRYFLLAASTPKPPRGVSGNYIYSFDWLIGQMATTVTLMRCFLYFLRECEQTLTQEGKQNFNTWSFVWWKIRNFLFLNHLQQTFRFLGVGLVPAGLQRAAGRGSRTRPGPVLWQVQGDAVDGGGLAERRGPSAEASAVGPWFWKTMVAVKGSSSSSSSWFLEGTLYPKRSCLVMSENSLGDGGGEEVHIEAVHSGYICPAQQAPLK